MRPLSSVEYIVNGDTGCWEWQRGRNNPNGYGVKWSKKKKCLEYAHRVYYRDYRGEITDGLWVLHHCDNKGCVNPDHLFLGTNSDNIKDAAAKGLMSWPSPRGEDSPVSKLREEDVLAIRRLAKSMSQRKIARKFGIARTNVQHIIHRRSWAWL